MFRVENRKSALKIVAAHNILFAIVPTQFSRQRVKMIFCFFFQIGGITMRRINRRLVLLSVLIACDVVCVFGRPQEQNTAATQSKGDLWDEKKT